MKLVLNEMTGNLTVIRYGKVDTSVFVETSVFMPVETGITIAGAKGKWWWASTSAPLGDVDQVMDGDYLQAPIREGVSILSEDELKAEVILMDPKPEILSQFQKVLTDNRADLDLVAVLSKSKEEK